jgi:hypothetical protein
MEGLKSRILGIPHDSTLEQRYPPGSIISPILGHIYLHELDIFVAKLKASYDKGKTASRNPLNRKIENLIIKANKAGDLKMGNGFKIPTGKAAFKISPLLHLFLILLVLVLLLPLLVASGKSCS